MVAGGEHGSNEWVGQTTITTAHSPAEDYDTSPANPNARTSPSSPFNISCMELGVHRAHIHSHTHRMCTHACIQHELNKPRVLMHTGTCENAHLNLSIGRKYMQNLEQAALVIRALFGREVRDENFRWHTLRDRARGGVHMQFASSFCRVPPLTPFLTVCPSVCLIVSVSPLTAVLNASPASRLMQT